MSKAPLAFIGLGAIGTPMAMRLLQGGFDLTINSRRRVSADTLVKSGANWADTPAAAAEAADLIFTCLPSLEANMLVYFGEGGLTSAGRPKCVIDLATTGPEGAVEIAKRLKHEGWGFLDSPVTGGVGRAVNGTLTFIVSGEPALLEQARPAFDAMGNRVFHVGTEPGQAQQAKLINNMLNFTALAASSEAITVGVKAGLDPDVLVEIINTGSGKNSATELKFPQAILPRTFNAGATNSLAAKDLSLFLDLADTLGLPAPIAGHIFQIWRGWANLHGEQDFTTIVKMYEAWAGVEVRGRASGE